MALIEIEKDRFLEIVGMDEKELFSVLDELPLDYEEGMEGDNEKLFIEIYPNRPDLLGVYSLAETIRTYRGKNPKVISVEGLDSGYDLYIDSSVEKVRPFTACAVVKGISFNDEKIRSIIQLQEKLHLTLCRNRKKGAIGIYPLEHIEWPIKYEAKSPEEIRFVPLEMDKELNGLEILEFHPTGKKYSHLLEKEKVFPIFRDNKGNVMSMPPIINSSITGKITESTTDVFIEVSGFNQSFLNRVLWILLRELSLMGGRIYKVNIHRHGEIMKSPYYFNEKITLNIKDIKKVSGIDMNIDEIVLYLKKMGFYDILPEKNAIIVGVPDYRIDIMHSYDLIEDILIGYGFRRIEEQEYNVYSMGNLSPQTLVEERVREICIGMGLKEILTYTLQPEGIKIRNALNERYKCLRQSLLSGAMEVLCNNRKYSYPQRYFEIGTIFEKEGKKVNEYLVLGITLSAKDSNFTTIKRYIDTFGKILGKEFDYEAITKKGFIEGRTAKILLDGKVIGFLGEIHPSIIVENNLEMPVSYGEIFLDKLFGF